LAAAADADPFGLANEPQTAVTIADEPQTEADCKCGEGCTCTNETGGVCECGPDCKCKPDKTDELFSQREQLAADYATNRRLDDIEKRIDSLEATQLDKADVEKIAEDVFRRLSVVVKNADGGQEIKTVQTRLGDGSILNIPMKPGQTLGAVFDPSTGQLMQFGQPRMVQHPAYQQPVQSYQFQDFELRQSPPMANGIRNVAVSFTGGSCANGQCGAQAQPVRRGWFR
ncbi:MAG: hypothetical protein ACO1RT_16145, partial [Planctomycetaceae bacterium]